MCFGSQQDLDVFIHVEICAPASGRDCTRICIASDAYEDETGALIMARFIVAVSGGQVGWDLALVEARKRFGTGRYYEIGNVTVAPQLCRNVPATGALACDF